MEQHGAMPVSLVEFGCVEYVECVGVAISFRHFREIRMREGPRAPKWLYWSSCPGRRYYYIVNLSTLSVVMV